MKNKKLWIGLIAVVLTIGIIFGVYTYYTKQDSTSTLTIMEKQWIESNKNRVIDLSIITDIPVLNYDGKGIILDFINDFEKDTNLKFNRLAYNADDEKVSEYTFTTKTEVEDNDIVLCEDHYVLLTKQNQTFTHLEELEDMQIGVLKDDLAIIQAYLDINQNLTYKTYDSVEAILSGLENEEVNAITLPRLKNLDTIISKEDVYISYHITEYRQYYVLSLGNIDKLNTILKKYTRKWLNNSFEDEFNKYLTSNYFAFASVDQKAQASFKSKRYRYGFVSNYPYDVLEDGHLVGINSNILKAFSNTADIEIEYRDSYNSIENLLSSFNKNEIDLFFGVNAQTDYAMDVKTTSSIFNEQIAIVSSYDNNINVNSLKSLTDKVVYTVKGTKISDLLSKSGIKVKEFTNISELLDNLKKDTILAIDYASYKYYQHSSLRNYGVDYIHNLDDTYGYVIRDISDNEVFANYLDFYVSFINQNTLINDAYNIFLVKENHVNFFTLFLTIIGGIIVGLFAIFGLYKYIHIGAKKVSKMGKADKLRYIDMLTSLKNRNYLNDNIDAWDESEVYPQSIVIVDLNNVAYINDNYGHQEGDNVIKEAANILIKTQIDNSDIIRTSGNEFLVYLVGHDEKEIVSYVRKINKEMRTIAHGFGAAVGYSMITDAIKTIDDAVNEATLDMRTQKEEANN